MAQLKDGDRAAFRVVYDGVWPVMREVAQRALASWSATAADVDDVVQEALLKLFDQAHRFDPDKDVVAWAVALVGWECRTLTTKRRRRRESDADKLQPLSSSLPTPEDQVLLQQLSDAVHDVLGVLSTGDREVLQCAFFAAHPKVGGVSASTLRKRKQRALERLKAGWRVLYGHD